MSRLTRGPVLAALLLIPSLAPAQDTYWRDQKEDSTTIYQPGWKEQEAVFPPVPRPERMAALDARTIESGYDYLVDPASVSVGKDGVVRFTIALVSRSGVRNVRYEGYRCETREGRTYGFVTPQGAFQPVAESRWFRLDDHSMRHGALAYRGLLEESYICDANGWPLREAEIRRRLEQASTTPGVPVDRFGGNK